MPQVLWQRRGRFNPETRQLVHSRQQIFRRCCAQNPILSRSGHCSSWAYRTKRNPSSRRRSFEPNLHTLAYPMERMLTSDVRARMSICAEGMCALDLQFGRRPDGESPQPRHLRQKSGFVGASQNVVLWFACLGIRHRLIGIRAPSLPIEADDFPILSLLEVKASQLAAFKVTSKFVGDDDEAEWLGHRRHIWASAQDADDRRSDALGRFNEAVQKNIAVVTPGRSDGFHSEEL